MLIDKYIENALYLYQCVIVPGFGGFIATEQDEAENTAGGKFRPAVKNFTFNPALRVNDGVLAMYISNMREISYAEAMEEISHAVDFYLSTLEKGDPVDIAGVGVIRRDGQGVLSFTRSGVKNFARNQYGLASAVADPIEKTAEKTPGKTVYEDSSLQIIPVGETQESAEPQSGAETETGEGLNVVKKAFRMVVDAATSAGIQDNTVENKAIGDMIDAVLMEAAQQMTIDQYRDNDQAVRNLISSAAQKAKKQDDHAGNQAIDDIMKALLTEEVARATQEQYQMETFSAQGFIEPEHKAEKTEQQTAENASSAPVEGTEEGQGAAEENDKEQRETPADPESGSGNKDDIDLQEDENEDDRPSFWHSKPVKAIVSAIVVVGVLAGLFFFVYKGGANLYFWKNDDRPVEQPALPATADSSVAKTDSLKKDSVPTIEQTVVSLVGASDPEALDTAYVADKPFYLIAGAVSSRKNARKYLDELRSQGYKAEYAGFQKGLYLIAYQGFNSRAEAMKMYNEIVDKGENMAVWIKVYNRNADKKTE